MPNPTTDPQRKSLAETATSLAPLILLLAIVIGVVMLCALHALPADVTAALLGGIVGLHGTLNYNAKN